jgi:hypothetical protein
VLQSARCRWRALRVTLTQVNALVKVQVASQIEFLLRHKAAAAKNEAQRLEVIAHAKERKEAAMKRLEQLELERAQKDAEQHQRFEEQHKRMQVVRQNREEQERLAREHTQKRMSVHQQRYAAVQDERQKELDEAAEVHRLKEEGKRYAEERTKRVQEYNKQCLINKIEHEKQRLEKMQEDVEVIKQRRNEEQKRMNLEKKKLQAAMNDFMRTGVWKKPEGVEMGVPSLPTLFSIHFCDSPARRADSRFPLQVPIRCLVSRTRSSGYYRRPTACLRRLSWSAMCR